DVVYFVDGLEGVEEAFCFGVVEDGFGGVFGLGERLDADAWHADAVVQHVDDPRRLEAHLAGFFLVDLLAPFALVDALLNV
nr:hypothetical protein [Tanacetum cinerariifolium]